MKLEVYIDGLLQNLSNLYLYNNYISKLQPGIFNNLSILRSLSLNNNHRRCLWQIKEFQSGIFNNLPVLYEIHLKNNQIIELHQNNIKKLESNSYYGLSSITLFNIKK